jgi:ferredoxin
MKPRLEEHPTVVQLRGRAQAPVPSAPAGPLDATWLRQLCRDAGADDAGFAGVEAAGLAEGREELARLLPGAQTLISLVCRLNPDSVRCVERSAADLEFTAGMKQVDQVARRIQVALRARGVRCLVPSSGFPMDAERWPEKMWPISHKPVAVAAGLGKLGHHRLFVHPRFGAFLVLGTVLIDAAVTALGRPLDFDPCVDCLLCVASCPVGAIGADGHFSFAACLTHNYRTRLGGFSDWVEQIVASRSPAQYRARVDDAETISMWQSLSYGVCNQSSYCMAVCPAGEEVLGPFLADRKAFQRSVVEPLQARRENVYVVAGSDGEEHARKRFPHKKIRLIGNGLRAKTAAGFLRALPLLFSRERSAGLDATFHFTFHGAESVQGTVVIRDKAVQVTEGLAGRADVHVTADAETWLAFLAKERHIVWAAIRGKIKVKGPLALVKRFGACFPS